jgi:hypothetical protein
MIEFLKAFFFLFTRFNAYCIQKMKTSVFWFKKEPRRKAKLSGGTQ